MSADIKASIDYIFRHEYGKIVSLLINRYSATRVDLIEDAVQEALYKAMRLWPFREVPANPSGWLYRTANNYIIDQLRRGQKSAELPAAGSTLADDPSIAPHLEDGEISDQLLKMIFACCDPGLTESEQIMLCLKLLCGLNGREIAKALLKREAAVEKTIYRAKQKLAAGKSLPDVPAGAELSGRLRVVMSVIYLLFNEGYNATEGSRLTRHDLCEEAIRLAGILRENRHCNTGALNALLALMCFNISRLDARVGPSNDLITLEAQDRSKWDDDYIRLGIMFINQSSEGVRLTEYHLEAGIAAFYATSESYDQIDWQGILILYDHLIRIKPFPVVRLNRLVVLGKVRGIETAFQELEKLEGDEALGTNYLFHCIKADFCMALGWLDQARTHLDSAIQLSGNEIERRYLQEKQRKLLE